MSSEPQSISVSSISKTSINVQFEPPKSDGDSAIKSYQVDYSTKTFSNDEQIIQFKCAIDLEVQSAMIETDIIPEVQIIHARMSNEYLLLGPLPLQPMKFKQSFVDESYIKMTLEESNGIPSVMVSFLSGVTLVCPVVTSEQGWTGEFDDLILFEEDAPFLIGNTELLLGLRRIDFAVTFKGIAPMSSSFKFSFRGSDTETIPYSSGSNAIEMELNNLPIIGSGRVILCDLVGLVDEY